MHMENQFLSQRTEDGEIDEKERYIKEKRDEGRVKKGREKRRKQILCWMLMLYSAVNVGRINFSVRGLNLEAERRKQESSLAHKPARFHAV